MKAIKFISRYWIWILTIIVVISVIVSSIEIYKEEVLKIDPDITFEEQNYISVPAQKIDTLNPLISNSEDIYYLSKLIYEPLFDYDENLNIEPGLVESFTVNTAKANIKIKLKSGVKWHDGGTLSSTDVAFTINAIKNAGNRSVYYDKVSKIHSVTIQNNLEFYIFFKHEFNASLDNLTFPIVPSKQFYTGSQFVNAKDNFKPIGTGMYKFNYFNSHKKLKLVPFKNYHGQVADKVVNGILLPEKELASNLMDIKEITCYVDDSANRKSLARDKEFEIIDIVSNNLDFIYFNVKGQYTSNKDFRQALAYGIDMNRIIESSYMEDGIKVDSIYYPNFLGVEDTGEFYKFDEKRASKILDKLTYKDSNEDGVLENPTGKPILLKILVNNDNSMRTAAAKQIKKYLSKIGINAEILSLEKEDYLKAIKGRKYDLLITGLRIEEGFDLRTLFNGRNDWKYSNYTLSQKLGQLEMLHTPEEYKESFKDIKTAINEELPYYPICYKKMSLIGLKSFKADKLPKFNNLYGAVNSWSWTIEKTKDTNITNAEVDKN